MNDATVSEEEILLSLEPHKHAPDPLEIHSLQRGSAAPEGTALSSVILVELSAIPDCQSYDLRLLRSLPHRPKHGIQDCDEVNCWIIPVDP